MNICEPERVTQDRVIRLFRDELGFRQLGDWGDRKNSYRMLVPSATIHRMQQ